MRNHNVDSSSYSYIVLCATTTSYFWGKFTIKNRIVRMHSVFFAIKTKKKSFLFLYSRKKAYFCPKKLHHRRNEIKKFLIDEINSSNNKQ